MSSRTPQEKAAPAIGKPTKPRPYRDFLTPALHRKFTSASLLALGVCYAEAVWMGEWDIFWQWFPLGFAGMRTLMLFLAALTIFVLRVSRTHVGKRTTTSPFETLWRSFFDINTYLTFFWYTMSAVVFSEVYLWGRPADAKLGMVVYGRVQERPKLNERSVYFRTMFITLAFFHSLAHLVSDQDRVPYPLRAVKSKDAKDQTPSVVEAPLVRIRRSLPKLALSAGTWSLWLTVPGTFVYFFIFRSLAWGKAFSIVQYMYFLPKAQRAHPTGLVPFGDLVGRVLIESFLIVFLWQFTNVVYSAYISQEPLKKDNPLTADSKDPNGSLIVGLKAKKEFAKATAFWELALITTRFPERRQTIYSELDRKDGSTWSQIQSLCLAEVSAIRTRIDKFNNPIATQSSAPSPAAEVKGRQPISAPLKTDPIFVKAPLPATELKKAATYIGDVARKHGNSPNAKPLQKALEYSSHKLLTDAQRDQIAPAHIQQKANGILTQIVHNPYIGYIFQQSFSRRASSVIFNGTLIGGTQYSTASVTVSAVDALSQLLVQSLKEDKYGQVSQSVPSIIRTYTAAIKAVEVFLANSSPHWSDVDFQNSHRSKVGDVEVLMEALREGLENIFGAFGEYLEGMGMSQAEIAQCKGALASRSASGGKKEMEKVLA